ncbi:MAG: glycosyl hydrolase 108 family protein [Candidatus Andersenbacteria bacterium]
MGDFQKALSLVLKHEGGIANVVGDNGGITNFGISLRFYKKKVKVDATPDDIKALTVDDATNIYKTFFWDRQPYAEIVSQPIASKAFDFSVNMGPSVANSLLQKAINSVSGAHLVIDGQLGAKSLDAINKCDADDLWCALVAQAISHYASIAEHNENDKKFLKGWINRARSTC